MADPLAEKEQARLEVSEMNCFCILKEWHVKLLLRKTIKTKLRSIKSLVEKYVLGLHPRK